jgi:nitric oxide reductase subunit C
MTGKRVLISLLLLSLGIFAAAVGVSPGLRNWLILGLADAFRGEIRAGKAAFAGQGCSSCHTVLGTGSGFAPDLTTAHKRLGEQAINARIESAGEQLGTGRAGQDRSEARNIAAYLRSASESGQPDSAGSEQSSWFQRTFRQAPMRSELAAGAVLLQHENCLDCHIIAGTGGNRGPRLDSVSSRRDAAWIADYLADPQKYKADTEMPDFKELSPEQRQTLGSFVITLSRGHRR